MALLEVRGLVKKYGRRTVANKGAVVNRKRVRHGLARQRLLHCDDLAQMRLRVHRAVAMIFHGNRGHVLTRGAVYVHVTPRDHCE